MKKIIVIIIILNALTGCAWGTLAGGRITDCQKHRPAQGHREIRPAALLCDILLSPFPVFGLALDFADGAMYKPCPDAKK